MSDPKADAMQYLEEKRVFKLFEVTVIQLRVTHDEDFCYFEAAGGEGSCHEADRS